MSDSHSSHAQGHDHSQPAPERQSDEHAHHQHMVADYQRRFWISTLLTLPILLLSPMIRTALGLDEILAFSGDTYVLLVLSSAVFFYGGWPFLAGLRGELATRNPGMMTLIGLAITTAYAYSSAVVFGVSGKLLFWELATLIDIMLVGHWIEMSSVMGAGRALEELASLMPDTAHKMMRDGSTEDVPVGQLRPGDQILIKPGEKVPADGIVVKGETSVNESLLTGESQPVDKKAGEIVIGGSINGEGSLTVEVDKTGEDSFLAGVVRLVQEAQASKSRTQDLAGRAAFWLTIVAVGAGGATMFVWLAFTSADLAFAMERTVTVMVITCPHALGLAVPLVVAVSSSIAASNGLLIRERAAFEDARNTQAIIFDKTGTLTKGEFGITDVLVLSDNFSESEIVAYAASVEAHSEHPIARGIVSDSITRWEVEGFAAIAGRGAKGSVQGKTVQVVSPGYVRESGADIKDERFKRLQAQGKTVVFVLIDGTLAGAIALADIIRPESREAISRLQQMGIHCLMLTGDNEQVANWVAEQIGLDEVIAEVLPEEKAAKVKEIQSRGLIVAMTGDGVNDAPALAQADVGIAIGAGTDVAIETADIILVRSSPLDVVAILGLARATYRKMAQNLVWATGYNAFAIPAAAGVFYSWGLVLSPAVGAVLMSLSTVVCAVNSKLLRLER